MQDRKLPLGEIVQNSGLKKISGVALSPKTYSHLLSLPSESRREFGSPLRIRDGHITTHVLNHYSGKVTYVRQ
jgi:hypothetical protein